jgi:hypothetical protein
MDDQRSHRFPRPYAAARRAPSPFPPDLSRPRAAHLLRRYVDLLDPSRRGPPVPRGYLLTIVGALLAILAEPERREVA